MEARIEPVGDPNMIVEWFLNGHPLAASQYIKIILMFEVLLCLFEIC